MDEKKNDIDFRNEKEISYEEFIKPFKVFNKENKRNPKRIDEILGLLKTFWDKYPDLRLGQIISNATPNDKNIFYIEDDKVIEWLKENINK